MVSAGGGGCEEPFPPHTHSHTPLSIFFFQCFWTWHFFFLNWGGKKIKQVFVEFYAPVKKKKKSVFWRLERRKEKREKREWRERTCWFSLKKKTLEPKERENNHFLVLPPHEHRHIQNTNHLSIFFSLFFFKLNVCKHTRTQYMHTRHRLFLCFFPLFFFKLKCRQTQRTHTQPNFFFFGLFFFFRSGADTVKSVSFFFPRFFFLLAKRRRGTRETQKKTFFFVFLFLLLCCVSRKNHIKKKTCCCCELHKPTPKTKNQKTKKNN